MTTSSRPWSSVVRWSLAIALLVTIVTPIAGQTLEQDVEIVEDGPSLPPGEDSAEPFLDSQPGGDHYLMRGYGHEGEYRVLDGDLSTVKVLEPPEDGFVIKGTTFSEVGLRLLVWGKGPGDANDTVRVFDVDEDAYGGDLMPSANTSLVTFDHARLLAGELILMVAGRDGNGTSRVHFIETMTNGTRNQLDVPGNRTVVHSEVNADLVIVLDEEFGIIAIDSTDWSLRGTEPPTETPPTVQEVHDGRFWTLAFGNGTVSIGRSYGRDAMYEGQLADGPLQGALYNRMPNDAVYVVTARAGEEGGSILEVWWASDEEWPLIHRMPLEGTVAFIHHVPGESFRFWVGYEDGSVVQYSIDIQDVPPEPSDPFYKEGKVMVPLFLAVVVILLLGRALRRGGREG